MVADWSSAAPLCLSPRRRAMLHKFQRCLGHVHHLKGFVASATDGADCRRVLGPDLDRGQFLAADEDLAVVAHPPDRFPPLRGIGPEDLRLDHKPFSFQLSKAIGTHHEEVWNSGVGYDLNELNICRSKLGLAAISFQNNALPGALSVSLKTGPPLFLRSYDYYLG